MKDHSRQSGLGTGRRDLAGVVPELTRAVVAELVSRIPTYQHMPQEELLGDISTVVERNLRLLAEVLRSRTLPEAAQVAFLRESAARRAEEGIPIEMVLTAYHIGIQVIWEAVTADLGGVDAADVAEVTGLLLRYLELVSPVVAAGYISQTQTMFGDEHSARQNMLAALLNGEPARPAADQAGLTLSPSYLVVAFRFGEHSDETAEDVDPVVAGRRKLRRLRGALDEQVREPVLASLTAKGGIALLPRPVPPPDLGARDWSWLDGVASAMTRAAKVPVTAGVAVAEASGAREAASTARQVLDTALAFGRPPGVYRLEDVLLEYQLSRPSEARDQLAAVLTPLADKAELLETLSAYLRLGDRRAVAEALHVHPNTVDYRLRRVHTLTGLDPTKPRGITTIGIALTVMAAGRPAEVD